MKKRYQPLLASTLALGVCLAGATVAQADTGGATSTTSSNTSGTQTVVRKTVQQLASPSGEIITNSMYTQVTSVGNGNTTVEVPIGANSVRNLNGFGRPAVNNGTAEIVQNVDGSAASRVLSDADLQPVTVKVDVTLDGIPIAPEDVINKSGVLDVTYTIVNTTARMQQVTYTDGAGNPITETVQVADPMAASVAITLPEGFNEITAPGATVAGDGQNGNQLGYTVVLFQPLGNTTSTVSYQSRITNATMPKAVVSVLPIVPMENSTIASTVAAYESGGKAGAAINDAGVQIGDNLLKLQDGTLQLIDGLGQLSDGAGTLVSGLGQLDDGAGQLSSGLGQLSSGAAELSGGLGLLNTGGKQLQAGIGALNTGAADLSTGAGQVAAGATQLSAGITQLNTAMVNLLPAVTSTPDWADFKEQAEGVDLLIGIAESLQSETITDAVSALTAVTTALGSCPDDPTVCPAPVRTQLLAAQASLQNALAPADQGGSIQTVMGILQCLGGTPVLPQCPAEPLGEFTLASVEGLIQTLSDTFVDAGGPNGTQALNAGGIALAQGATQLAGGAAQLSGSVSTQLVPGINQLAGGLTAANAGAAALSVGASTASSGGQQLADGLSQAASGAPALVDGLGQAADGAQQIAAGAGQLKSEGADVLAATGNTTAIGFNRQVAQIKALQALGEQGAGIPYGKATGDQVTTTGAYQITLQAPSNQRSADLVKWGLGIIGLVAAAGLAVVVTRRRVS